MPSAATLRRAWLHPRKTYARPLLGQRPLLGPLTVVRESAFRPGVRFDLLDDRGNRLGWGRVTALGDIELFDAASNRLGNVRPTLRAFAENGRKARSYAPPIEALKEGETLQIGPEGKRGVWRSIGGNPVFIAVRKGESVPEAVRRVQASTSGPNRRSQDGKDSVSVVDNESLLVQAKRDLDAGFELAKEGTSTFNQQLAKEELVSKTIDRRFRKVMKFDESVSTPAVESFRTYADVLGEWTAKTGREVGVLIDNHTGRLVGPIVKGGTEMVFGGPQFELAEDTGDYSHLHTHPAAVGFSDLDLFKLTEIPALRRLAVRASDGRTYVISKRIGVKYSKVKEAERIPKFNRVQGQLRGVFGEAVLRASGRQFLDDVTRQDLQKPKVRKLMAAYVHEQAKRIAEEFDYDYAVFKPRDRKFVGQSSSRETESLLLPGSSNRLPLTVFDDRGVVGLPFQFLFKKTPTEGGVPMTDTVG